MRVITFLLLLFAIATQAQVTISGVVRDSEDNLPLPFATIIPENGSTIITDVDGRFILEGVKAPGHFTVTYTGYKPQAVTINSSQKFYTIKLASFTEELGELVISSSNPANAIIKEAVERKPLNDPQQKLNSFRYKAYDRLIVTANPDSISEQLDSIFIYEKVGRRFEKLDSTNFKFKKMIEKRHLYQTEKVSEFNFNKPQGLKENVLATRMAGFKKPLYELIALKLQSYSVYGDIDLMESKYAGPLSSDHEPYRYSILDTVSLDSRNTYMVYFTSKRKNKKFRLEGILYIDMENYGVAKAIFRAKNVMDITSTHFFKYEKELGLWFPDSKTLKIVKGNNKEDIRILGETIKFDAVEDEGIDRKKEASDFVYLLLESQNFDKEFNIPLTIKHAAVAIEISEAAISRPESYWDRFRTDTPDARMVQTYPALDSIIGKENLEQRIFLGKKIINFYLPLGAVDLDLRQIAKYNVHEGFRLGLGGITNDKFSEIFRISGYGAYGTKDGEFKYSGGAALRVGNFSNSWIGFSYTDDLREIASTSFATDKRKWKIYDSRPLNISTFYNYQSWEGYIESRLLAKTESRWQLTRTRIDPLFAYIFKPGDHQYSVFNLTTLTGSIQWNPFSDYMQTPTGRVEIEKRFPQFTFQLTQAIEGFIDSDFTFSKLDFRGVYEKKYLNGQKTSFVAQTGIAIGDTPLTHLYNAQPNSRDKETILSRIRFAGKNSFETMYFNEFFSSQYVILQAKHALRKYTLFGDIKMAPVLVTRFAWGNMEDKTDHIGLDFNTLEKGYYESGIELNEIYKIIGITAFYRYGPYHLPQFDRNISLKVSITLNLFN